MAVPEEIRRVPRPTNTFVVDSKTGVYSVREKTGCGYYVDDDGKVHNRVGGRHSSDEFG